MKIGKLKSGILFYALILLIASCCKKESKQERIEKNLATGTWKITEFSSQGSDQTSSVASYNLTFGSEGNLSAGNGSLSYYGTWSINYNEANTENQTFHLSIIQNPSNVFENVSGDWKFIGQTSTRIKLKHENATTDYLIIERAD